MDECISHPMFTIKIMDVFKFNTKIKDITHLKNLFCTDYDWFLNDVKTFAIQVFAICCYYTYECETLSR